MSTTKLTKGITRVEKNEPREVGIATKVTGANIGAITHIISLEAERVGRERTVTASFARDGHLLAVTLQQPEANRQGDRTITLNPGDYLLLESDEPEAEVLMADDFAELFRPLS